MPHYLFTFPLGFLSSMMLPHNFNQRNSLVSWYLPLLILNSHWSFHIRYPIVHVYFSQFRTCVKSDSYFLSIDMQNTSCTQANFGSKARRYTNNRIRSKISNDPTYLGLSLPFFPNCEVFCIGDTLRTSDLPLETPTIYVTCLYNFSSDIGLSLAYA